MPRSTLTATKNNPQNHASNITVFFIYSFSDAFTREEPKLFYGIPKHLHGLWLDIIQEFVVSNRGNQVPFCQQGCCSPCIQEPSDQSTDQENQAVQSSALSRDMYNFISKGNVLNPSSCLFQGGLRQDTVLSHFWSLAAMQKRIWDSAGYRTQRRERAHLHIRRIWKSWYIFFCLFIC